MSEPMLKVVVAAGKYTVVQESDGRLHALRYGEPWRDLVGDNLVLALAQELEQARTIARMNSEYARAYELERDHWKAFAQHLPDCDANDQNIEGIKKPCNCGFDKLTP